MAVIFGPSPVTLRVNSNPNLSPALSFPDNVISLRAILSHWTSTATARFGIEQSFDGGATWVEIQANGPTVAPSGTYKNRVDLILSVEPAWKRCGFVFPANSRYRPGEVCAENFEPNRPWNGSTTNHSDYAFQDTTPLTSLSQITFHNPDGQAAMAGPLRQIRASATVNGNVSSQLLIESF